ncbi:MAG: SPFH domain-containing protein [Eubacteriales bacterium]|nr:SPFH domain-containing protein [Clostridiales bacterium]MDY5836902.1 SPFH domain-containing protein [Eubacteriales bacterium]
MGFIRAFTGALSGSLADQWLDFYMPDSSVPATAAIFPAKPQGQNKGRGENTKGNANIISNGSKILVPEATALITMQDGMITGIVAEAGGFIFSSDDVNSQSIFAGDGLVGSLITSTWEKIKFGGQVGSQQLAFYVNLKEIPNNRFGTQSEIYWDDSFFGTQVGAVTRGTYTLKIVDPLLFVKNFVPQKYLLANAPAFDFADMDNDAAEQLFNEVVGSLSAAFSNYTNDPSRGNRMSKIQGDQIGFAHALSQAVEDGYQWKTSRGLEIVKTAILAIEYDEDTKALMSDVKKADALSGARGNSFFQQAAARGLQSAGENGGGANMAFMGMGMNAAGNMMGGTQQANTGSSYQPSFGLAQGQPNQGQQMPNGQGQNMAQTGQAAEDPTEKLIKMKKLLDAGVISEEEFNKIKFDLLGL